MQTLAFLSSDLSGCADRARTVEERGIDGLYSAELSNDPFFPLVVAAEHTKKARLLTAIAVAFARNPMVLANIAHDLNAFSGGRFTLGIGSQIRPHITKRFSMPWSKPASRMREYIAAMHAIWDAWYDGKPLNFRGDFYTHTLMTPMFTPPNTLFGRPKVALAGVGAAMTRVAGEVADGFVGHGFTTRSYLEQVTIPALEEGLAASGRTRKDFEISCPLFLISGADDETRAANRQAIRQQLSFYGSTPAYRPVLDHHGWGEMQDELHRLSKQGEWVAMADVIDDGVLAEFAITAEPGKEIETIRATYGHLVDTWLATHDVAL